VIILNAQAAIKTDGSQSTVILSNSTIAGNANGVQILNGGTILTSGNDTIVGNGTNVTGSLTSITSAGGSSNEAGHRLTFEFSWNQRNGPFKTLVVIRAIHN
jgi:hypothetical protein